MHKVAALTFKAAALVACLVIAASGHPPARAQESARDAVQDTQITQINDHLKNSDRIADLQSAQINSQAVALAELQTEQRVFFSILTLLVGGSIVVQVRVKKA